MPKNLYEIPLSELRGISTAREKMFCQAGICSIGELLRYYPRSYENRGKTVTVSDSDGEGSKSLILEVLTALRSSPVKVSKGAKTSTVQRFIATDKTGSIEIAFFNRPFLKDMFVPGRKFRFYGPVTNKNRKRTMVSPEFEPFNEGAKLPELVSVYPLTSGLTQRLISACIKQALEKYKDDIPETLPPDILERNNLIQMYESLTEVHFPKDSIHLENARRRLAFEELYDFFRRTITLGESVRRGKAYRIKYPDMRAFTAKLPFELTLAQKHAIQDILIDITSVSSPSEELKSRISYVHPSRRLVQGDVGCGKTIVACAAVYAAALSGFQSAVMVPTGILARQHYEEMSRLLEEFGIKSVLLTGGMRASEKKAALAMIKTGQAKLVIGTHALIEEGVLFDRLALVITDEQHRFGVMQRKALEDKAGIDSIKPHVVVMSATPIPRTLAMIMYCDLDISIIDKMPKGRKPVETYAVGEDKRTRVYNFIADLIKSGRQAYIVCPLADRNDSDVNETTAEMKSAREYCESLKSTPLGEFVTEYIHGKMKPSEKEEIMGRFASGKIDVLVSTTVIEVGVNVPNATVMLVENAERFGLSQLHQLRGRGGRGKEKSYCILMSPVSSKKKSESNFTKRLDVLCKNNSGFTIAEKDLELRGPGEFFGVRQSGEMSFRIADIAADMQLVYMAKAEAENACRKGTNANAEYAL